MKNLCWLFFVSCFFGVSLFADYYVYTCVQGENKIIFTEKNEAGQAQISFTSLENNGLNNFNLTGEQMSVEESCENITVSGDLKNHPRFSCFTINFVKSHPGDGTVVDFQLRDNLGMPLMGMPYQCSVEIKK